MSTVICSAASSSHAALLDCAEPRIREYARRWGWDVHLDHEIILDRPVGWYKVDLLHRLLLTHDTVIWVDADALIVDTSRNILSRTSPQVPLWLSRSGIGRNYSLPNCGVIVAYKSARLADFLDLVWEQRQFLDHPWWEQAAILHLLGWEIEAPGGFATPGDATVWSDMIGYLSHDYNSMPLDPSPMPVIKHWPGMRLDLRLGFMRREMELAHA